MNGLNNMKKKEEPTLWSEDEGKEKPKRKRSGSYSKNKGSAYERQILNELKEVFKTENLFTARSDSKNLDNMKIDISDPDSILPFYVQCKKTQTTPSIKKLNDEVGKKDKPLAIFWNAQQLKDGNINITSQGEYVVIPKELFYRLLNFYCIKLNNPSLSRNK